VVACILYVDVHMYMIRMVDLTTVYAQVMPFRFH